MANISLKSMLEASIDPKLVARSKKSGKLVYFKTPQHKADALKAGSHEEPKKDKKAQTKQSAKSADMFKGDYGKERGGYGSKPGPSYKNPLKSKEDWDDLRSIYGGDVYDADGNVIKNPFETEDDFSDIKGPKPGDSDWSTEDVFNATFKDPDTGKEISVGDAYDREDDSPAYNKAFDYVSQFNPDDEKVIVGPGSKKIDTPTQVLPKEITDKMSFGDDDEKDFHYLSNADDSIRYGIVSQNGKHYVSITDLNSGNAKVIGKTKDAKEAAKIYMDNLESVKSKYKLNLGESSTKLTTMIKK